MSNHDREKVLEAALIECAVLSGEDMDGDEKRAPTWPPVEVWAVQCVKEMREAYDESLAVLPASSPTPACARCGGHGTIPTGVMQDFDSGLYEADDEEPCPECAAASPTPEKIERAAKALEPWLFAQGRNKWNAARAAARAALEAAAARNPEGAR